MRSYSGEPDIADVLTDPIVLALMRADRCDLRSLYETLEALRADDAEAPAAVRPSTARCALRSG